MDSPDATTQAIPANLRSLAALLSGAWRRSAEASELFCRPQKSDRGLAMASCCNYGIIAVC